MLLIISKVLVVFIYIGIGFVANKLKVLPDESTKYIINLAMEITVPCMMISSIVGQELKNEMYLYTIIDLVITALALVLTAFVSMLAVDRIFRKKPKLDRNVLSVAMTTVNSGFMGFPVTLAVFGTEVLYYVIIQNISSSIFNFTGGILMLHRGEGKNDKDSGEGGPGKIRSILNALKPAMNFATIITLVAVVMLFAGIRIPQYAMDIFDTVGNMTVPLTMMLVGVQLGGSDFSKVIRNKSLLIASAFKLMVGPAVVLLFVYFLPIADILKLTAVICTCFPSAVISVVIAAREERNPQLMAEAVAATTMMSMVTLPIWILIVSKLFILGV